MSPIFLGFATYIQYNDYKRLDIAMKYAIYPVGTQLKIIFLLQNTQHGISPVCKYPIRVDDI